LLPRFGAPLVVSGVGQNPNPIPPVRGIEGTSRNNNRRERLVIAGFQIRKHRVEEYPPFVSNEAIDVLCHDEGWPEISYNAKHLRPEIAVILRASSLPGV